MKVWLVNLGYKKIIKNQETRFKLLNMFRYIPDKWMISLQYYIKLGRFPQIKNPERFTEKLQWYKLYYRDPIMTEGADKYTVRNFVNSKGLSNILNKLYEVYESPNEIEFPSLPQKFVMKTTNGSGTNYICHDKSQFPLEEVKIQLQKWLRRDIYSSGREWSYKNIKPRIIVEELLESNDQEFEGITDYKFMCFNGKAKYIIVDVDRHVEHKRNIYDLNWNIINVSTDYPNFDDIMEKPEGLDEMIEVANKLSKEFPFVRVDLYWVNNKVYFGELTFYPWTGYVQFQPDEFDYTLGKLFELNKMIF